jgi:hypothetical protein
MKKPEMMLQWAGEKEENPISRKQAADLIRTNRRQPKGLQIIVWRTYSVTYIATPFPSAACRIFKA